MSSHPTDQRRAAIKEAGETHVPSDALRGDYDGTRVHEAADAAETVSEVANTLRVKFCDAKHDLAKIGRYREFKSGQELIEKLQERESKPETNRFASYKQGDG